MEGLSELTQYEIDIDEGVFLTAGWLTDFYKALDEQQQTISMNSNYPQYIAEGMLKALEIIKNHI